MKLKCASTTRSVVPLTLLVLLQLSTIASGQSGDSPRPVSDRPMSPEESLRRIKVPADLTVDLVACEPLVIDPVAVAWNARGELLVVEMRDYPLGPGKGQVKILRDTNRDGRMDSAEVLAELAFPTSVTPTHGGYLVTASPMIGFLPENARDGKRAVRPLFTGLFEGNQQLRANGLCRGLDNWYYGANGRSDGVLRSLVDPKHPEVPLRAHDFRFDPRTGVVERVAGFSQFGQVFDDAGNRFLSWNTQPVRHVVLPLSATERNPHLAIGALAQDISDPEDGDRIYPLAAPGPRMNREPPGYFNASCGISLARGGALPREYHGNVFVCEPLFNIVSRKVLTPKGITFVASRAPSEKTSEFLASTDPWFRPVNTASGPDGALYVVDFYREWVEHPHYTPPALRDKVPFRKGDTLGRIYRVRSKSAPLFAIPDLTQADDASLIAELGHPNAWRRETAQRLLVEGQRTSATEALIVKVRTGEPLARVHAIWTLAGLSPARFHGLDWASLAAGQPTPVLEQIARALREVPGLSAQNADALARLATHADARIRFQVALAATTFDKSKRIALLAKLARRVADDGWSDLAILCSLADEPNRFLTEWLASDDDARKELGPAKRRLVETASYLAGRSASKPEISAVKTWLAKNNDLSVDARMSAWLGLLEGARRGGLLAEALAGGDAKAFPLARRLASDTSAAANLRASAVRLLAFDPESQAQAILLQLLDPATAGELQRLAIAALGQRPEPHGAKTLLERFRSFTPASRRDALEQLAARRDWLPALLDGLENRIVLATDLDLELRQRLLESANADIKARATKLLATPGSADRAAVLAKYQATLQRTGTIEKGREHFVKNCSTCHHLRGVGSRVGPELSGLVTKSKEQLLSDILDPNREILPQFVAFLVEDKQGASHNGLLVADSATGVTLRRAGAIDTTLARGEIESFVSTNRSLMPVGFEQTFTPDDLADLLAFLRSP